MSKPLTPCERLGYMEPVPVMPKVVPATPAERRAIARRWRAVKPSKRVGPLEAAYSTKGLSRRERLAGRIAQLAVLKERDPVAFRRHEAEYDECWQGLEASCADH